MRRKHSARSFLNRFSRNERGNFAMILAIVAIPLMGIIGLGIDLTRAYIAQTRLQNAVDNAALAAAGMSGMCTDNNDTSANCTKMKQITTNYFYSNYKSNFWAPPAAPTLTIDADGTMHVSATATSPNYFLTIFGYNNFTVASAADAIGGSNGLEVAMVLDNTGSMNDCVDGSKKCNASATKMAALKSAALALVNTLYGSNATNPNLKIGIVPFTSSVRVDSAAFINNGWIDKLGRSSIAKLDFDNNDYAYNVYGEMSGSSWQGCVEARPYSGGTYLEETDDPPDAANPDTLFVPFFAPDNPDTVFTVAGSRPARHVDYATTANLSKLSGEQTIDGTKTNKSIVLVKDQTSQQDNGIYVTSNKAWKRYKDTNVDFGTAADLNQAQIYVDNGNTNSNTQWNQTGTVTTINSSPVVFSKQTPANSSSYVNSYLKDVTSGTPLQHQIYSAKYYNQSPDTSLGSGANGPGHNCVVRSITALTSDKTTIINAINALTPDGYTHVAIGAAWGWRVLSPGTPYTEGAAYSDKTWQKALIILTDGDNTMPDDLNGSDSAINGSDYTAYGFVSQEQKRLGQSMSSTSDLVNFQNESLKRVCANIKAVKRPDGSAAIHIYTVGLGVDLNANLPLLKSCATSDSDAYTATTTNALSDAFAEIANSLARIRLTK